MNQQERSSADVLLCTFIQDAEFLKWGCSLSLFRGSWIIYYASSILDEIKPFFDNKHIHFVESDKEFEDNFHFPFQILKDLAKSKNTEIYSKLFYVDWNNLYKYFNFYFLEHAMYHSFLGNTNSALCAWHMMDFKYFSVVGGERVSLLTNLDLVYTNMFNFITSQNHSIQSQTIQVNYENVDFLLIKNWKDKLLHILGDSHTLFLFTEFGKVGNRNPIVQPLDSNIKKGLGVEAQVVHHIGSVTMHSFSDAEKYPVDFYLNQGIKKGDWMIFVCGEIDVRNHLAQVAKKNQDSFEKVVELLTSKYIKRLVALKSELQLEQIMVVCPPPPLHCESIAGNTLETKGNIQERVQLNYLMQKSLEQKSNEAGLLCLEINSVLANEKGELPVENSDMFCHVSSFHSDPAKQKLIEALLAI